MSKTIYKQLGHVVGNLLVDIGWQQGHSDYTKFVVITRSRSGSNLLKGLLNSHPNIFMFGEAFREANQDIERLKVSLLKKRLFRCMKYTPIKYLNRRIFRDYPEGIKAVGFKIFYYHARNSESKEIWNVLQTDKSIKIIHLRRRNRLKTYLSREIAGKTDVWSSKTGDEETIRLKFDPEKMRGDFELTEKYEEDCQKDFSEHSVYNLVYEDFVKDLEKGSNQVLAFLGVERRELIPSTEKQARKPIEEVIENYDELKREFSKTKWKSFFK